MCVPSAQSHIFHIFNDPSTHNFSIFQFLDYIPLPAGFSKVLNIGFSDIIYSKNVLLKRGTSSLNFFESKV
jgi:hypothetical protein